MEKRGAQAKQDCSSVCALPARRAPGDTVTHPPFFSSRGLPYMPSTPSTAGGGAAGGAGPLPSSGALAPADAPSVLAAVEALLEADDMASLVRECEGLELRLWAGH